MKKVGQYQLIAEIKRSALGATYRGWDTAQQRLVLLKTFKPQGEAQIVEGCTARFSQEAEAYSRIAHPNIVKLWDYGYDSDVCYLALEFVEGWDLRRVLQQFGALPVEIAVAIIYEALHGLAEIHRQNIIHRDLKPENILLGHDGQVKLCDFDLATQQDEAAAHAGLTGSPGYVAPEAILGEKLTSVADIFSLAVVFYELLTGARPFHAGSPSGEMSAIVRLAHLPLHKVLHDAPMRLEELLDLMLAKRPQNRLASAAEAQLWLANHFEVGTTETRAELLRRYLEAPNAYQAAGLVARNLASPINKTARHRRWAYAAAFAGILLLSVGWFYWQAQHAVPAREELAQPLPSKHAAADSFALSQAPKPAPQIDTTKSPLTIAANARVNRPAAAESAKVEAPSSTSLSRTILIRSNPWAYLFLNGDSLGMTPLAVAVRASTTPQQLAFKNPQFPQVEAALQLETQTADTLTFSLWERVAQLELQITPWAEVYINDEKRTLVEGEKSLLLLPGKYRLRFVHPQLGEKTETVSLRAGEARQLAVNMF